MRQTDEQYADTMRQRWGARNYEQTCRECGRVFDMLNETDADEFYHGHDCE